jgi:stress response protein YsnF
MAIVAYSQQDEFDLVNSGQDCMGWTVIDQAGNNIGEVNEMLIETDEMKVDSIMVSGGGRIPAENIALRDGRVVVRGVLEQEQYAETQHTATATSATAQNYEPMQRDTQAKHVAGITREANENEITLPIIEEQMTVGKRTMEKGGVNVRTTMSEKPIEEAINLREESVTVERHKVDRPVDNATEAFKEGSFDVTTQAEIPVISKQARVVEEVVIGKEMTEHRETIRDTVMRTDVEIDEINTGDTVNRRNG